MSGDFKVFELMCPRSSRRSCSPRWRSRSPRSIPRPARCASPRSPSSIPSCSAEYRDQIDERDVTPDDFGRIAAQTAKQVILQRIREAERDMMFDEYQDRVGELITGIVQQSDSRYTLVQLRERVEALLPKSEQVGQRALRPRRARQGGHHRRLEPGEGPEHHRLAPLARADPQAVRARGARDRRRPGRDPERRARARLPLEDRGGLARQRRGSGRRLRRPARLARAHGRVRAARREDRHHPLQRGARPLRGQGALARARARGARRRRGQAGHRDRARTTSCRSRSARRARTPGSPRASPAGAWTSARRPSSPRKRRRWATRRRRSPGAAPRSSPTAAAARTPRCRARATAACPRTRRWPTRHDATTAPASGARRTSELRPTRPRRRGPGRRAPRKLPSRVRAPRPSVEPAGENGGADGAAESQPLWRGTPSVERDLIACAAAGRRSVAVLGRREPARSAAGRGAYVCPNPRARRAH